MNRNHMLGMLVAGFAVSCASWACSSDVDELRERARAIQREAAELAERGRPAEAEKLEREALELLEAAERRGKQDRPAQQRKKLDPEIEKLEAHLVDLRKRLERLRDEGASKREQAEAKEQLLAVERELDQLHAERKKRLAGAKPHFGSDVEREHAAKIDAATERIHHIVVAAEHLDQAGIHDLAGQLRSKAASMKEELGEQTRRLKEEAAAAHRHKKPDDSANVEVLELRQLVKRLQAEIKELREQAERRQ